MTNDDPKSDSFSFVDTHCHLYQEPLQNNAAGVKQRAMSAAVHQVVIPAYDQASWNQMPARSSDEFYHLALGIHPWLAAQYSTPQKLQTLLADLQKQSVHTPPVAIGEIGLDTKVEAPIAAQLSLLEAQLEHAIASDLPVILHCRGAYDRLLAVLANQNHKVRGVVHAYTRGPELGQQLIDAGLHLGFGGHLTRPDANRARLAASSLPLERIVLETDAPNIGLAQVPAAQVEPAHTAFIAQALAELRGVPVATIADATTLNAQTLFNLPVLAP